MYTSEVDKLPAHLGKLLTMYHQWGDLERMVLAAWQLFWWKFLKGGELFDVAGEIFHVLEVDKLK